MKHIVVEDLLVNLRSIGGFDVDFYLKVNPDVAEKALDPLVHYLMYGWTEGRDPCANFSTAGYLRNNPDVARAGICPLIHFWNHGLAEGRRGWQVEN